MGKLKHGQWWGAGLFIYCIIDIIQSDTMVIVVVHYTDGSFGEAPTYTWHTDVMEHDRRVSNLEAALRGASV